MTKVLTQNNLLSLPSLADKSIRQRRTSAVELSIPPWKAKLQALLKEKIQTISLSTTNNNRPVSRSLPFLAFHSNDDLSNCISTQPITTGKLLSLLQFQVNVNDIPKWFGMQKKIADDRFMEVNWFFIESNVHFRLSGKVFLVTSLSVDDPMLVTKLPPWGPKGIDWQLERENMWKLRNRKTERTDSGFLDDTDRGKAPDWFGVLLIDVDCVEEMVVGVDGGVGYEVKVPRFSVGRISGIEWETKAL